MKQKNFDEMLEMYLAGEVDMYAQPLVSACVPGGTYLELLGIGGEKVVISYMDTVAQIKKVLNIRIPTLSTQGEKRFFRGARILQKIMCDELRRGNVPPFPYVFEIREYPPFYVTEFIAGSCLRDYIHEQTNLTLSDKLFLFKKLCEGLHLLHSYGVVHRDLKPYNVMVQESGDPKLIDFGIAMSQNENPLTRTDARLGTPEYAAPEQMSDAGHVDERADIYSFAKVLYFIMVGEEDFDAAKLPVELMFCIPRAWQHDIDRRQETVLEFLNEVAEAYPEIDLLGGNYVVPQDFGSAQAFTDLLILYGGNTGKVKKILQLSLSEWESLMEQARRLILVRK